MSLHFLSENYTQIMSKKASKSIKNGGNDEKAGSPDAGGGDLNVIHNVFAGWNLTNKLLERINNNDHIKNLDDRLEEEENGIDYRNNKVDQISDRLLCKVFSYLDFKTRIRVERVCGRWRRVLTQMCEKEKWHVWLYLIFRRGLEKGHDKVTIKISTDGPIFWSKLVAYVYCCSCHFNEKHEPVLLAFFQKLGANSVRRLCAVDSPLNLPFLTNSFYEYLVVKFENLEFLYLRELDLENLNVSCVRKFMDSARLKKVIVHDCINYDAMADYGKTTRKLMVFRGPIQGLRVLLGDEEFYDA